MQQNRTTLPLPLNRYDEAGRVLPPLWLHWALFWGARALILLAATIMLGPSGENIPLIVYPSQSQWLISIGLGVIYLLIWLGIGRREWFWQRNYSVAWVKPVILMLLITDVALQVAFIAYEQGRFSLLKGAFLLLTLTALVCVVRSKHLAIMMRDWRG
ncbi:DUF2919 family protein [Alteromonas sediminis]|uniref:DUF2919 family protein n=1 Tax=Alteromonas sediminis TaxID=2259342 RepID=A0A3N5Y1P6_9ALTE|nr:DUF2919 family protein [Alteromonas sediminis]RPJ67602.1 DUF2919 family protein [Alteromonas sediminis]